MLVYDGLRDWIYENYKTVRDFCKENSLDEDTLNLIISGKQGTKTETLNEICKASGLKVEQIVRWVPDSTKRVSDIYKTKEPCYDKLLRILKERGLSKTQLCLNCGMKISTLGTQLNTQRVKGKIVSYRTIKKAAEYLGVSPLDLFEPKDESIEQREADKRKTADMELPEGLKKVIESSEKNINQISAGSGVHYSGLYNAVKKGGKLTEENINRLKSYFKWEE